MPEGMTPGEGTDLSYVIQIVKECEALRQGLIHVAEVVEGICNRLDMLEGSHKELDGGVNEFLTHFNKMGAMNRRSKDISEFQGRYKDNAEYNDLAGKLFEAGNIGSLQNEYGDNYKDSWEYFYDLMGQAKAENSEALEEAEEHVAATGGDEEKPGFDEGKWMEGTMGGIRDHMAKIAGMVKKELPEAKAVEVKAAAEPENLDEYNEPPIPNAEKEKMAEEGVREAKRLKKMKGIKD